MPKILYLISFLTSDQRKKFHEFLLSSYLNPVREANRESLANLLRVLSNFKDLKKWEGWETKAYSEWKPKENFNQNTFRKSCSELVKLYHQFLGFEHYQEQKGMVYLHQLRGLNQARVHKYFEKFYLDVNRFWDEENKSIDSGDFAVKSEMYHTYFSYSLAQEKRDSMEDLDQAIHYLDQYYLLQKVKYILAKISQNQILGSVNSQEEVINLIQTYYQVAGFKGLNPLLQAYFLLLKSYVAPKHLIYYNELRNHLFHELENIETQELRNLINGVINFCVFQIRQGESSFRKEFWALYQLLIDREAIWINGKILAWDVINLTVYHLEEGDYDWVESFIQLCEDRLIPSQRQQVKLFCRGLMAYYKKEYKQARKDFEVLLGRFDDVFYGLNVRVAKARLLYEIEDSELDFLLESAPAYIKSQKISPAQKIPRLNFFRFLKRIHNTRPYAKKRLAKLKEDILKETRVNSKKWLLEKIQIRLEF